MKIGKILVILVIFILTGVKAKAHPFYVSICQIEYNKENQSLEISIKIFADDLIAGLEGLGGSSLFIGEPNEKPEAENLLRSYLLKNLSINIEGKMADINYLGKEMEEDVVWCYLEITGVSGFSEISVSNTILTEVYETQSNIVNILKAGKTESLLLTKRRPNGLVEFE